jgi:hypothetical protein
MVGGRVRKLMGWMLPAFMLAMVLHAHPAPDGALQIRSPDSVCPVCATLRSGAGTPSPQMELPLSPEPSWIPAAIVSATPFFRIPLTLSLRGPPPQA